jgi:hypothetical protein
VPELLAFFLVPGCERLGASVGEAAMVFGREAARISNCGIVLEFLINETVSETV